MWLHQDQEQGWIQLGRIDTVRDVEKHVTGEAIRATETGTPLHACAANHKVPGHGAPQFCLGNLE